MGARACELHYVVETSSGLYHGDGADGLSEDDEEESGYEDEVFGARTEEGYGGGKLQPENVEWGTIGEKCVGDEEFRRGGAMRNVICGAIAAEEEGGNRCLGGIITCRSPEFEKMEKRKRGDETWHAPEYRLRLEEQI